MQRIPATSLVFMSMNHVARIVNSSRAGKHEIAACRRIASSFASALSSGRGWSSQTTSATVSGSPRIAGRTTVHGGWSGCGSVRRCRGAPASRYRGARPVRLAVGGGRVANQCGARAHHAALRTPPRAGNVVHGALAVQHCAACAPVRERREAGPAASVERPCRVEHAERGVLLHVVHVHRAVGGYRHPARHRPNARQDGDDIAVGLHGCTLRLGCPPTNAET